MKTKTKKPETCSLRREAASLKRLLKLIKSGYVAERPHSQQEIAELLGVDRTAVKQVEGRALRKMKLALLPHESEVFDA